MLVKKRSPIVCAVFLSLFFLSVSAQDGDNGFGELSSKLTDNFSPKYKEYSSKDTTRKLSVKFDDFKERKLVFFDQFIDNRHTWPHWSSMGDSVLQECLGIDNNYICRTQGEHLADSYTDMFDGQKVVACFTPDQMFKYSNQVKLGKNYVLTLNPLSIKQVSKLPSTYYEGYCEHTTRIHRSFDRTNFGIETEIIQAVGNWGLIFGNFDSERPYYYFKVKTDNSWSFYAVYPNKPAQPIELETGSLPMSYLSIKDVRLEFTDNKNGGFKVEFWLNEIESGKANVTRMPLPFMDIGYRLDHNSIDGNNIVIANKIAVYEKPIDTYLEEDLKISGLWTGVLRRGKEDIYDVKAFFKEDFSGYLLGRLVLTHRKYKDIVISKNIRASREKNIINYEEFSASSTGIKNKAMLHSIFQMGNMELYSPDSIIVDPSLVSNLHRYGEYNPKIKLQGGKIYLSRKNKQKKTITKSEYDSININRLIVIKKLFFVPDLEVLEKSDETVNSLDNLARQLQRYLSGNSNKMLLIHGHTDIGAKQGLSLIRAKSIQRELENRGLNSPIFCIGHGNSKRLIAVRGDERNRRVEVEVVPFDYCTVEDETITMQKGAKIDMLRDLPNEYILTAQFRQTADNKVFINMKPSGDADPIRWQIPNTSGGKMQTLKVKKRYNGERDAIILEFILDDVNRLTMSQSAFSSFGIEVKEGTFRLDNLVIAGPR